MQIEKDYPEKDNISLVTTLLVLLTIAAIIFSLLNY